MSLTPKFQITELEASQSQPEVPVNLALRILEAMAQCIIVSKTATAPPGSPTDGDCYIVGASATGAWAAQDGKIAVYVSTRWIFVSPKIGFSAYNLATSSVTTCTAVGPFVWS